MAEQDSFSKFDEQWKDAVGDQQAPISIAELALDYMERLEALMEGEVLKYGVPMGFIDFDRSWQLGRGKLTILAGMPNIGKSTLALNIALNAAVKFKAHVGLFSIEMDRDWIIERLLSIESGVDTPRIKSGNLNEQESRKLDNTMNHLQGLPIMVDDTDVLDVNGLRDKLKVLKEGPGLDLAIVDPLEELLPLQSIGKVMQLRRIARELNIPILAVTTQITKADLRGNRRLEFKADEILFLDREEKHNPDTDKRGVADLKLIKSRSCPGLECQLLYLERTGKFLDLEVYRAD